MGKRPYLKKKQKKQNKKKHIDQLVVLAMAEKKNMWHLGSSIGDNQIRDEFINIVDVKSKS